MLRENGADESVDIATHVMLPNGIAQATLPIVIGILRDCVRCLPAPLQVRFAEASASRCWF